MAELTPEDDTADAAATALATGLTLLTAGLGVFGGLTGSVARMARNHETRTGLAVSLVLLSVVLALASRLLRSTTKLATARAYRVALWAALGCFVVGVGLALLTLNTSLAEDDRPSVTAAVARDDAGSVTLTGTAKAGGLEATDHVLVRVQTLVGETPRAEVYSALVGPDQDGVVTHDFTVLLAPDVEAAVVTVGNEDTAGRTGHCGVTPAPSASATAPPVSPPDDHTACAYTRVGAAPSPTPSVTPSAG